MVKLRDSWTNYVNDQTANPLKYFKPSTLPELIAILHEATQKGYKVKPIGSGHSSSDIAVTADFMIDTHALDRELNTRFLDLASAASGPHPIPEKDDLFFVECGITIHAVNKALEKKGKALINMGAYAGQTIAGVLSTSTHGSGAGLGAFPAFLKVAILLLSEDGTLFPDSSLPKEKASPAAPSGWPAAPPCDSSRTTIPFYPPVSAWAVWASSTPWSSRSWINICSRKTGIFLPGGR